jgi:hypothetical protein
MNSQGQLNEAGLALALNRRPHLAAVLRLLSKNFERGMMERGGGGGDDEVLRHGERNDVKATHALTFFF